MTEIPFPSTPFTVRQALAIGLTPHDVRAACADGRLTRLLRDVYIDSSLVLTPTTRAQAAALTTSRHVVVCDRTASWVHGVDCWRYFELDVPARPEVCVLRGHEPSERPELRCLTRDLSPADIVEIDGLRVTSPLRTALDLGCRLSRRDAYAAMNALARAHEFGRDDVLRALRRYRRRRGVIQLRQLAVHLEPRVDSWRESWTLLEIIDHGLPTPEPQHAVVVDGRVLFLLDLAYPHAKVAVEYDGEEHHSSDEDRAHDAKRRAWLRARGWTIIVVTKASFDVDAVPGWIYELRLALRMAA